MIRKLQKRFIRIAMAALTVAMVLVTAVVNLANWISVRQEMEETLSFLLENEVMDSRGGGLRMMGKTKHVRNLVSESNWFSVYFDEACTQKGMNLLNMAETDAQVASGLAARALESGKESGFLQDYLYRISETASGGRMILFLNCETKISSVRMLAMISLAACLAGIGLAWLFVTLASRRVVEPTIRNMEQQKQFITNASHELKTPLTVISTNMELLAMESPGNTWIRSTQKQTAQMRHLVDELVYLSRMEEENAPIRVEALDLAALARETAEPFQAMAEFQGRELRIEAPGPVPVQGDRAAVQRLISTLCDNAVKYAAGESPIEISVRPDGRNAVLAVKNETEMPLSPEQCRQLFRRFYRAEESRSKEKKSGFGIGLAIASAIAEKHGGAISAAMEGEKVICFTCVLPRGRQEKT